MEYLEKRIKQLEDLSLKEEANENIELAVRYRFALNELYVVKRIIFSEKFKESMNYFNKKQDETIK